jgi:hypothetical protein
MKKETDFAFEMGSRLARGPAQYHIYVEKSKLDPDVAEIFSDPETVKNIFSSGVRYHGLREGYMSFTIRNIRNTNPPSENLGYLLNLITLRANEDLEIRVSSSEI